jgi:hypothetical protein
MPYGEDAADPLRVVKIGLLPPDENTTPNPKLRREVWRFTLSADQPDIVFHAWMERDDLAQAQIVSGKVDARSTLGATACAQNAVVVGAFDGRFGAADGEGDAPGDITPFRPIRNMPTGSDDLARPDLAAPGHSIWAAWSKRDPGFSDPSANRAPLLGLSGTSMAAPHVAGAMALMIQKRFVETGGGAGPTQDELRAALRAGARPIDRGATSVRLWHPRFGFGRLDVVEALRRI